MVWGEVMGESRVDMGWGGRRCERRGAKDDFGEMRLCVALGDAVFFLHDSLM